MKSRFADDIAALRKAGYPMMYGLFGRRNPRTVKQMSTLIAAASFACVLSLSCVQPAFADTVDAPIEATEEFVEELELDAQPPEEIELDAQPPEETELGVQPVEETELEAQLVEGTTISIMGDSISTYAGWSDSEPIADESCVYRYGEAYYGPEGGDYHNTDLLVTDTWWHQAAEELGGEILVSNAGNSTGLLHASYPSSAEWEQYLQDQLAYESRPYYLGTEETDPDIIALYIGSNDVAKAKISQFGTIDAVDFETLITESSDGDYVYAEPTTVAEAYCILLHKIGVTYPDAETYCFTVVPNSGGNLNTCNKRLEATYPFNEMIKGVAARYGATVVDLFSAFGLDADGDGAATQEELDAFKTYFNGDPHPNAAGFDVITECFVSTVLANSDYVVVASDEDVLAGDDTTAVTELDADMTYVNNEAELTGSNGLIVQGVERVVVPETPDIASGYEFEYIGSDKLSNYWAAELIADESQSYEGQGPVYSSEDGTTNLYSQHALSALLKRNFLVPRLYLGFDDPVEGSYAAQYDSVQQFVLVDEEGNPVTTYCADLLTPAIDGYDYVVKDIESATYYGVENAAMIRTIALNGYWGADPGDGDEPAFGSLASVKKTMANSGEFTDGEIDQLNDGMAMTATQYAIWTYSNSMDKRVFVNAYYTTKASLSKGLAAPESDVDLIFKLYRYLITLPPTSIEENTTDNTIIESENFLKDSSLIIVGKPMGHPANQDADDSNDVYAVDLSLAFKVVVKAENGDDLVLTIMDGEEVVAVGRVAGELREGERRVTVENGRYIISGLTVQEGNAESLRIVLSGTQNLSEGVYLFVSEAREEVSSSGEIELVSSQSMVGIAKGARSVNAVSHFAFELDVDDEAAVDVPAGHAELGLLDDVGEAIGGELAIQAENIDPLNTDDAIAINEGAARSASISSSGVSDDSSMLNDGAFSVIAQTSDDGNMGIWATFLCAGGALMAAISAFGKKRAESNE